MKFALGKKKKIESQCDSKYLYAFEDNNTSAKIYVGVATTEQELTMRNR